MEDTVHMALFKEDQVDHVAEAISRLRSLGVVDKEMSILSGVPYSEKILDRPMGWTRIPIIALAGAGVGAVAAILLVYGSVYLYPLRVGGMSYYTIQSGIPVIFELTMLGLLISTFLGVFIETITPSYGPKGYDPRVSDGYIGILFSCPDKLVDPTHSTLIELGAEIVDKPEVKS
jgi:hypothetical protein